MITYLVTGLLIRANDKRWLHQTIEASTPQSAADLLCVDGWTWSHCETCHLNEETIRKMNKMTCPHCGKISKKHNEPTLSDGGFLDQIYQCSCGWCGVDSVALSDYEIRLYKASVRPKQMRLL